MWWIILGYSILFLITYYSIRYNINKPNDGGSSESAKGKWQGVLLKFIGGLFWPIVLVILIWALIFTVIEEILQKDPPKWL
jgi:hypothetical protein